MTEDFSLTNDDKGFLIQVAREAVRSKFEGRAPKYPEVPSERVRQQAGAFVTLRMPTPGTGGPALRGCIGHVVGSGPLTETVADSAVSAAFRDPRFPPLTVPELERVYFEVSVLSPLRRVSSAEEVIPGTHGVLISAAGRSGLLLPQVATEQGWDRETFLSHCCYKAQLPGTCFRDPNAEIQVFTAIVFDEHEVNAEGNGQ
ncbi:MAG: AmmeMemoRadiSam system protein A [Spirochaetaceae bacterium]